jgi:glycosyltransferase involved in cell wall biosynthesis
MLFKLQMPIIRFVVNHAALVIAANEYEKNIFSKFCNSSKIEIIKNGIDKTVTDLVKINFKEKYNIQSEFILFLGRFHKVKGVDVLLHSISMIKETLRDLNTKLVVMGVDFGFESEMLQMIKNLQISDVVIVIKNPPRQDVLNAYNESKFLVLPSRWELSPLTPLEGFAFKKTVISTNAHGIPYTISDGLNSILVPSENANQLASAIVVLLHDPKKCLEYGENGYRLVQETCNSDNMAKHILEFYEKIIRITDHK